MADDKRKAPDKKIFRLHDEEEAPSIKEQYAWLIDGAVESVLDELVATVPVTLCRCRVPLELRRKSLWQLCARVPAEERCQTKPILPRMLPKPGSSHRPALALVRLPNPRFKETS